MLDDYISRTVKSGNLTATTDFSVIKDNDIIIVTVGTPLGENYAPNMDHIKSASESLAKYLKKGHLVILKSVFFS